MGVIFGVLISLVATLSLIYLLSPRAHFVGLVDKPSTRKVHEVEIPTVGGIAIFGGFLLAMFSLPVSHAYLVGFVLPALLLVVVGVVDDVISLSHRPRFIAQILAGLLMTIAGGVVINQLGVLLVPGKVITLGLLSIPFTLFCLVGLVNALNMSDGIDGLAGLLTLVALLGLGVVAYIGGRFYILQVLTLLGFSLIGFLAFNVRFPWRKSAAIFLGDSGSTLLGFAVLWFSVHMSQGEHAVMTPVTALWFVALPFIDMTTVFIRRVCNKQSPFQADREHLHHLFLAAGFSVGQTAVILTAVALLLATVGIAGLYLGVPENAMFALFLGLFVCCFYLVTQSWKKRRFLRRTICRRAWQKHLLGQDRRRHPCITDQKSYEGANRRHVEDRRI
jgi:UDP-GlcNAc:undecaprenyl-phosphate/decaprenyl-phosphate GlcNAc-1-phosphate transferase